MNEGNLVLDIKDHECFPAGISLLQAEAMQGDCFDVHVQGMSLLVQAFAVNNAFKDKV